MTPTKGLTMEKVTDVQLALHQICADEANPRSMTASIMRENGVTTDDVMLVCDVAYLAIEDMRSRNLKASLPDFDVNAMDAKPPSSEEMRLIADQELPQMPSRTIGEQKIQHQVQETENRPSWYNTVMQDIESGVVIDREAEERAKMKAQAEADLEKMKAQTEENKAKALRMLHGET